MRHKRKRRPPPSEAQQLAQAIIATERHYRRLVREVAALERCRREVARLRRRAQRQAPTSQAC